MILPEIRRFQEEDYSKIDRIPGSAFGGMPFEVEARLHSQGPSFTAELEGKIMFCVGVDEMWDGVGSVWLVLSPEAKVHPGVFYALQTLLGSMMKKYHRLQACVRSDWLEARRFAEWFGFHREGVMQQYGPNKEDYFLYSRVR